MEPMSLIQQIKEWWWMVSLASTCLFAVAGLYLRDKFITKEEHARQMAAFSTQIGDVKDDVEEVGNRVVKLEAITENLPDREAFQDMSHRIAGVEKAVAVTTETVSGVKDIVAKIDRTLDLFLEAQLRKETKTS